MSTAARRTTIPAWAPPAACGALFLALAALARLPLHGRGAAVVPPAVAFDLVITVPLLWWLLAVRGRGVPLRSLAFVFAAGVLAARVLIGDRTPLTRVALAAVGGALELAIAIRLALAVRAGARGADTAARIGCATESLFGRGPVARAVADEFALLGYALAGPWRRPVEGPGRFSHQDELGRGSLIAGMLLLILFEAGAVHMGLVHSHPTLAWTLTLSSVWGALWLFGDYQALRLRRSTLENGVLELRVGLRASASVPVDRIVAVRTGTLDGPVKEKGVLRAYPKPATPTVLLELDGPLEARVFYSWPLTVTRIALAPDDRARFLAELEAARN